MRYVIVSLVEGEAADFNEKFRREVFQKFKAKSSKLPAHITVKAPFEYDKEIYEIESSVEKFCNNNEKVRYEINGYGTFARRAIFMKVIDNEDLRSLHKRFIKAICNIDYITFGDNEGPNAVFHITIASKKIKEIFNEVWNFVNERQCFFNAEFNNISIFRWEENTWKLYRKFELK